MKKFMLFFIISVLPYDVLAVAMGTSGSCFSMGWNSSSEFYFCGDQDHYCHGDKAHVAKRNWIYNNQKVTFSDGSGYCCCGGNGNTSGTFKPVPANTACDSINDEKTETKTVDLGDEKSCKYIKKVDYCEREVTKPCTVPKSCSNNRLYRNGVCVADCVGSQVFEGLASNTCIDCPTTVFQGPVSDPEGGGRYCKKCDTGSQLFKDGTCVEKKSRLKVTPSVHIGCWLCKTPSSMRLCMEQLARGQTLTSEVEQKCSLDSTNNTIGTNNNSSSSSSNINGVIAVPASQVNLNYQNLQNLSNLQQL